MVQSTCLSDEQLSQQEYLEEHRPSNNSVYIVYWSSLVLLLQYCLFSPSKALVNSVFMQGSALVDHLSLRRLQKRINKHYERNIVFANIVLAVGILFSANTFSEIKIYFELGCIPFILHTSFYNHQKDYLLEVANAAWVNEKKEVVPKISKSHPCAFSGD